MTAIPVAGNAAVITPTAKLKVEESLAAIGLPVGAVDGIWTDETRRGICAWRELQGYEPDRKYPTYLERREIFKTRSLPKPAPIVVGLHINRECQTLYWVARNPLTGVRVFKAVMPVSSGQPGYETPEGNFKIQREIDSWHESSIYEDAWMYRPKYFADAVALHGSATDSLVKDYPASHGCVRMFHKDIDRLWKAGVSIGYRVFVYGDWEI